MVEGPFGAFIVSAMPARTSFRASSFIWGATESSRSNRAASASMVGPLPTIFSLEPGMKSMERKGVSMSGLAMGFSYSL